MNGSIFPFTKPGFLGYPVFLTLFDPHPNSHRWSGSEASYVQAALCALLAGQWNLRGSLSGAERRVAWEGRIRGCFGWGMSCLGVG